ncbi:unnamed protein product [Nippostrongylus brasiliensis]|uniref:Uncharacterized protein n=1 Tax=Nippostrongylus brasiliensis TaxID=27835 RepID=A0A0N4YW94_NIPBR|nr:unnamed protein product [Nippostrongylus brasiliensis]
MYIRNFRPWYHRQQQSNLLSDKSQLRNLPVSNFGDERVQYNVLEQLLTTRSHSMLPSTAFCPNINASQLETFKTVNRWIPNCTISTGGGQYRQRIHVSE